MDAGLIEGFPTDYTPYITANNAAVARFEDATGWVPFLAAEEDSTQVFKEWSKDFMDVRGYAAITSVTFDDEDDPGVEGTDYDLKPTGRTPVRWLKLWRYPSQKLTIVGKPGYSTELPADVKQAVLAQGASQIATLLNGTGQVTKIRQGDVEYAYAPGDADNPTTQYAQWTAVFDQTVKRYSRRSFA